LLALFIVSTHVLLQRVGALAEQPVAHAYVLPELEQTGADAPHAFPHPPQLAGLEMSISQP
jgi:hypothetical protein